MAYQGVSKTYDMPNAYEFAQLYKESRDNAYLTEVPSGSIDDPYNERGATGYYKVPPIITAYLEDKSGTLTDTDWQDAIFRTALAHKHSLSVSGRTKTLSYYVAPTTSTARERSSDRISSVMECGPISTASASG